MIQTDELAELVEVYANNAQDTNQVESARRVLELIQGSSDYWKRTHFVPGHITASAFVVNSDRSKVLLMHHKKLERWLQPGGHFEPEDTSLTDAVLREVLEESGLTGEPRNGIFDIDIHPIPERGDEPKHLHFDIRVLVEASESATLAPAEGESTRVEWLNTADITSYSQEEGILRMGRKL